MSDAQMFSMYKTQAVDQRHELERIIELNDRFRDHTESLAKVLAGQMSVADFEPGNIALCKELESEEYRFLEWHNGDKVWNSAIHTLAFEPGAYRDSPHAFARHALEASIIFDKMIRDALRELHKIRDHIAALSDAGTAEKLTLVDAADKPSLWKTIKNLDDGGETILKWGKRAIVIVPHIKPWLDIIRAHLGR